MHAKHPHWVNNITLKSYILHFVKYLSNKHKKTVLSDNCVLQTHVCNRVNQCPVLTNINVASQVSALLLWCNQMSSQHGHHHPLEIVSSLY